MKGPNLQRTAVASAVMHLTFFLLSMIVLKKSGDMKVKTPYIVNLVSSDRTVSSLPAAPDVKKEEKSSAEPSATAKETEREKILNERTISEKIAGLKRKKEQQQRIDNAMRELQAKNEIASRFKNRDTLSVGSKNVVSAGAYEKDGLSAGGPDGAVSQIYFVKVREEIWKEWTYPEHSQKDLETIVFVKIAMNGAITIQGIEKSSGDSIFDNSVVRAITKASPVSRPPYEMEIGIRFYP